jgi:hypothetical protein
MSKASVSPSGLLTVEEYAQRPDSGYPDELVRGKVVSTTLPSRRHGQICAQSVFVLRLFLAQHDLGHVLSNDAGEILPGFAVPVRKFFE